MSTNKENITPLQTPCSYGTTSVGTNAKMQPDTPVKSTQNLLAMTCETTLDHPHGINLLFPLFDQEYNQITDGNNGIYYTIPLQTSRSYGTTSVGTKTHMEPETPVGYTQNLSAMTCETTLDHPHGNNLLFPLSDQEYNQITDAPTIQSRKEYHKSYYQRHRQKNIATDVSEEDHISQDDPYDFVYNGLPKEHFLLKQQPPCVICGAKKIQYEFPTFCCI
ncbi:hypothetical protein Tco_0373288, partial [Tanacetum coccineum]